MGYTEYDKSEIFNEHIAPLIDRIDGLCATYQIPFFFTAAVKNNAAGTKYENRGRTAIPLGITLMNDLLANHMMVCNGFDVVFPDVIPDIEL